MCTKPCPDGAADRVLGGCSRPPRYSLADVKLGALPVELGLGGVAAIGEPL